MVRSFSPLEKFCPILQAFFIVFCLASCAPGLGTRFSVDTVETVVVDTGSSQSFENVSFRLADFEDRRVSSIVADINGRELEPEGDPIAATKRIVQAQFRDAGLRPSAFEGRAVYGELLEWKVIISPGFPSTLIEGRAGLRLGVRSSTGESLYSARYAAEVSEEHPIGSTERIERVFARALAQAAAEALNDERFVSEIRLP
jgi:hypothetical protein